MENTIQIKNNKGEIKEAILLERFEMEDTKKEYIVYHLNETDEKGMTKLYAGLIVNNNGNEEISNVETDEEWIKIKKIMKTMAKKGVEMNNVE